MTESASGVLSCTEFLEDVLTDPLGAGGGWCLAVFDGLWKFPLCRTKFEQYVFEKNAAHPHVGANAGAPETPRRRPPKSSKHAAHPSVDANARTRLKNKLEI